MTNDELFYKTMITNGFHVDATQHGAYYSVEKSAKTFMATTTETFSEGKLYIASIWTLEIRNGEIRTDEQILCRTEEDFIRKANEVGKQFKELKEKLKLKKIEEMF